MEYVSDSAGSRGWISGDGEAWSLLGAGYNFAVVPTFVAYEEGMAVKSLDGEEDAEVAAPDAVKEAYLTAGPNPFNPRIEIRFGLPAATEVKLDVFDVRGLRVARLVDGPLAAGHHTAVWSGVDDRGRRVASGIYVARMLAEAKTLTRRVTLIK